MGSFTSYVTGGLIDPSSSNYARLAGSKEAQRKGLINLGLNQIGAVYGGGTAPFYSIASQHPFTKPEWRGGGSSQTFYNINRQGEFAPYYAPKLKSDSLLGGSGAENAYKWSSSLAGDPISLTHIFSGLFGSDPPTPRQLVNKKLRKGLLYGAPDYQTFEGFQPEFYNQRAQDYINFALPQEAQQYQQSRNAMLYGLSNRGLSNSSVGQRASADLERTAGQARQTIADTGLEQANQLRRDVENSRQQEISQLYQTGDPAQASQSAISASAGFQRPSVFAPLGNLFSSLANQYYTNQVLNSYRQPFYGYGSQSPNYSMALGPVYY